MKNTVRDEIGAPAVVDRGVFQAELDGHHEAERRRPRRPSLERRDDIFGIGEFFQALARDLDHLGARIEGDDAIAQKARTAVSPGPCRNRRLGSRLRAAARRSKRFRRGTWGDNPAVRNCRGSPPDRR